MKTETLDDMKKLYMEKKKKLEFLKKVNKQLKMTPIQSGDNSPY